MTWTDETAVIDTLPLEELRRFAHHQHALVERLLRERETHLSQVEAAFRRRHNAQQERIVELERKLSQSGKGAA